MRADGKPRHAGERWKYPPENVAEQGAVPDHREAEGCVTERTSALMEREDDGCESECAEVGAQDVGKEEFHRGDVRPLAGRMQ